MKKILIFAMALFISACHRLPVTCRSEYLYPDYLASQQINTPDPARDCFLGQKIVVSWNIPKRWLQKPVTLLLHVRYGTREVETFSQILERPSGWWEYTLLNTEYTNKCGIVSFQAELVQQGRILSQWNHFLWVDILEITQT